MTLPDVLIRKIKEGKVILFLGSGALYGATIPGKTIPLGDDLRDILSDHFLGGELKDESLAHVSALAISTASLFEVQQYISSYFEGLLPADFHRLVSMFHWRAIFTTNYDRLVEVIYENADEAHQKLVPIFSNSCALDETRRDPKKLPLVKLHGCITKTRDERLPLILTVDQYNDHLDNRNRLFTLLYELAYEYSIVFVGHSLQDPNIRKVLGELKKECPSGQKHYLIKPGIKEIESDFWGGQNIKALNCTFEDFLTEIQEKTTDRENILASLVDNSNHPIQKWFCDNIAPSVELADMLHKSVELVNEEMPYPDFKPEQFFKGFDCQWGAIEKEIPITRLLESKFIEIAIEKPDAERTSPTETFVIKGEAGAGKTILMRQIAKNVSKLNIGIVLWVKQTSIPDIDLIEELLRRSKERVFVFWDDAANNSIEINRFLSKAVSRKLEITLVTAERFHEWNVKCEELDLHLTDVFELNYLSEGEIEKLVFKLGEHNCLGPNLKNKSHSERCEEFRKIFGRQLLVALHECTMGEPFEEIVFNEFNRITPVSAKSIYLTVCTLNRMRIPVRAGLISRIHDISFDTFKESFYKPLEKVVITTGDDYQDIHYTARHPEIAAIVFREALTDPKDRYNEYVRIINKLNISYSSDYGSFRHLVRAKALHELFNDYEDVKSIYSHALDSLGRDPYLLQQMAIYERIRPNGSLEQAIVLLTEAAELAPRDTSILHVLYTVWRDKARSELDTHKRVRARNEARSYLNQIRAKSHDTAIISTSYVELGLDNLKDLIDDEYASSAAIEDSIRSLQKDISSNKQKYPSEGEVYKLESRFFNLLKEDEKTLTALERSFELNGFEPFLAIKLANIYSAADDKDKARIILEKAIDRRRGDQTLHFEYAELLRKTGIADHDLLAYHYRKGFTPNDKNYESQFWFARFSINSTNSKSRSTADDTFKYLRDCRVSHTRKIEIRDKDCKSGVPLKYSGTVAKKRLNFGFIDVDGVKGQVFFSENEVNPEILEALREGDRVTLELGYTYKGMICCNIDA
ncbi:MAG: SIR2 family protein [Thalassolituus sp.]|jgi:tetratricopeptide (TPR) repeat protein/cold shock CspA family protein|uniref:P-loop NTPase n=1 Tax=Thalassolituus sp. TaxID=2030822 RepID=UPI003981A028